MPRDQGELGGGEAEPGEREVLAGVGAEAGQLQQATSTWTRLVTSIRS